MENRMNLCYQNKDFIKNKNKVMGIMMNTKKKSIKFMECLQNNEKNLSSKKAHDFSIDLSTFPSKESILQSFMSQINCIELDTSQEFLAYLKKTYPEENLNLLEKIVIDSCDVFEPIKISFTILCSKYSEQVCELKTFMRGLGEPRRVDLSLPHFSFHHPNHHLCSTRKYQYFCSKPLTFTMFCHENLKICEIKNKGKGFIAKEFIPKGAVLLVEKCVEAPDFMRLVGRVALDDSLFNKLYPRTFEEFEQVNSIKNQLDTNIKSEMEESLMMYQSIFTCTRERLQQSIVKVQLNYFVQNTKSPCIGKTISMVNHSLDPNSFAKFFTENVFLIAIKNIQPNEEICFMYTNHIYPFQDEFLLKNKKKILKGATVKYFSMIQNFDNEFKYSIALAEEYIFKT